MFSFATMRLISIASWQDSISLLTLKKKHGKVTLKIGKQYPQHYSNNFKILKTRFYLMFRWFNLSGNLFNKNIIEYV